MSNETPDTVFVGNILAAAFNKVRSILAGSFFPRFNGSEMLMATYEVQDEAGSIGTDEFPWLSASITVGDGWPGMLIPIYDYAETCPKPKGAMLCDGRVINRENYDQEHGWGEWDRYVGISILEGRHLPNLDDKYMIGGVDTQDGLTPITTVGIPGSVVDLAHSHGGVINTDPSGATDPAFEAVGGGAAGIRSPHLHSLPIDSSMGVTSFRPSTIVGKIYMRII